MEHRREFKEEAEIVEEKAEESPDEVQTSAAVSGTTHQTRDLSVRGRCRVWETGPPVSASLGAMKALVRKLNMLLLDPPHGCSSQSVKEKMQLLKQDVEKISSCLDTLSQMEDPPQMAKCWMNEVRDLSYNLEGYIDSLHVQAADTSVAGSIKTTRSRRKWFSRDRTPKKPTLDDQIVGTVSELRIYVQDAMKRHEMYGLKFFSTSRCTLAPVVHMLPTPMPYGETSDIVINDSMNEFINSLANDGADPQQLKVSSVLGSAYLGKTILARVLYNRIGLQFDCRAFIRVSKNPDMKKIFQDMLSELVWQPYQPQYCKEVDLINTIKYYLQNKRYLIIIDDLWSASVWDIINRALPKGSHGSRIITTTQIEDVAFRCCCYQPELVFEMKPLDDHHSRKLFFNRLSGSESDCPEQFKEILNEIVEICGGLPLATVSIASLLASQPALTIDLLTYIRQSLSSLFSANPTSERTRQALNLSFHNLPQCLKTCLLYLSMYQEGYTFYKDDLVKQWMAEGFIDTREGQDVEKLAESYLNQLISRRFIQPMRINFNNEVLSCAVHDMVHDLIAHKSAEENFIMAIDHSCGRNVALSHKVRRLSFLLGDARYDKIQANIIKSQLRSLKFSGKLECMPSITEYKVLRVLDLHVLGHDGDQNLDLTGISELFQLIYLKIACDGHFIKLPTNGLQCLETLNIIDATVVTYPWSLPQLLHLSLPFEQHLLDGIGRSQSPLGSFIAGSSVRLNNLQDLHLTATMSDLRSSKKALCSLIEGHANLKSLVMAHGSRDNNNQDRYYLDANTSFDKMEPPPLLQRFECPPTNGMIHFIIPKWVGKLDNLSVLKITVCELVLSCVDMLRGMPALTALSLYVGITTYEKIIFDKAGFSSLKYFKLRCTTGMSWLKFEAGAMPNLLKLKTVFTAILTHQNLFFTSNHTRFEQYKHGNPLIIIEHMPGLREISAKFGGATVDVEYALRTFVSNHPSNPTINMQPNSPKYDKTERPADERIPWLLESSLSLDGSGDRRQSIRLDVNGEASAQCPPEWEGCYKFTLDELRSATRNFSEENLLGTLGEDDLDHMYRGVVGGKQMVTIIKLTQNNAYRLAHLQVVYSEMMQHPHLVKLLGYCNQDQHSILVYEYMHRGSLKHHLSKSTVDLIFSLPWLTRLKIAVGVAKGLSFLHEPANSEISGQFNASSILLASDYTAKLWGFGLAMRDHSTVSNRKNDDIYEFGMVLLELLAGRPWFDEKRLGPQENLVTWLHTYLSHKGKLHNIMDPRLEGKYSLSAAWSTVDIACQCVLFANKKPPSMRDVVDTLEPLLSDDRNDGQSKKNIFSRWRSLLIPYGAVEGRGKSKQGEEVEERTVGASTLPMH
ncbi:hypothetical protein ACQJBY_061627 [Aegilops geniculata]